MKPCRPYIALVLCLVSLLMCAVPVLPHHHHADGLLCMKHDLPAPCAPASGQRVPIPAHHCCCNQGCVAAHFCQQTPTKEFRLSQIQPESHRLSAGLLPDVLRLADVVSMCCCAADGYVETLHGACLARAKGLRAPPCRG